MAFFTNLFPLFGCVPEETHGGTSNLEVGSELTLVRRKSHIFFVFLDSTATFFLERMETHLFGRALSRSHMDFFNLCSLLGCVPEETHGGTSNLEVSEVKC